MKPIEQDQNGFYFAFYNYIDEVSHESWGINPETGQIKTRKIGYGIIEKIVMAAHLLIESYSEEYCITTQYYELDLAAAYIINKGFKVFSGDTF